MHETLPLDPDEKPRTGYPGFGSARELCGNITDLGDNILHRLDARPCVHGLSILENNERGNAHNPETLSDFGGGINITFHHASGSFHLLCDHFEAREHDLARTAPLSPEVYENDARGNVRIETLDGRSGNERTLISHRMVSKMLRGDCTDSR